MRGTNHHRRGGLGEVVPVRPSPPDGPWWAYPDPGEKMAPPGRTPPLGATKPFMSGEAGWCF